MQQLKREFFDRRHENLCCYARANVVECGGQSRLQVDSYHNTMGRLVIAHHKSYHPYKAENIERVRKDEEEARIQEAKEEGRLKLAARVSK